MHSINGNSVFTCNANDFTSDTEFKTWLLTSSLEINYELQNELTESVEVD